MVTEDDDATLGMVWVVVAITFDDQTGHSWDGVWYFVFALKAKILCFVDHGVNIVIKEDLIFFLIAFYPSFSIQMILVCLRKKGGKEVALGRAGRYKRSAGLIWWYGWAHKRGYQVVFQEDCLFHCNLVPVLINFM